MALLLAIVLVFKENFTSNLNSSSSWNEELQATAQSQSFLQSPQHLQTEALHRARNVRLLVSETEKSDDHGHDDDDAPPSNPEADEKVKKALASIRQTEQNFLNDRLIQLKQSILNILYQYEPIYAKYYNDDLTAYNVWNRIYLGIKKDDQYCYKSDRAFLGNSSLALDESFILTDHPHSSLTRSKVVQVYGTDVSREIKQTVTKAEKIAQNYDLPPHSSLFYMASKTHMYMKFGEQFGCFHQMYGLIPGHGTISRKDLIVGSVNNYSAQYADKPKCFTDKEFFPKSYWLRNKTECDQFFEYFNSDKYKELKAKQNIVFMSKQGLGAHRGLGVKIIDDAEEKELRNKYDSGKRCGEIKANTVLQTYIHNPLLVEGRKFDFRIYMLVASTDPFVVYYHDGFLRVSLQEYKTDSGDKAVHLTNTEFSKEIFKEAEARGENSTELRNKQMWTLDKLQEYLLKEKLIKNDKWLDEYLRPAFKRSFAHLVRMARDGFYKDPRIYQLWGIDFMLDVDLNLWLIECNAIPAMTGTSEEKEKLMINMLKSLFEIEFAYLKSRVKRVHTLINETADQIQEYETLLRTDPEKAKSAKKPVVDWKKLKTKFKEINRNYLEPEYKISKENTFSIVMDEHLPGKEGYFNHIDDSCFE
eukprot:TRINITY_DN8324_c0_g1_i1.p1 TRINITY_DN8324_c0_g1~~TRINITY_DN8324_c0_g1_i1.p1  ORF type:complete len:644 (+),score=179.94 TRINITY_DN8324_c0_g1_i1:2-1933(+)